MTDTMTIAIDVSGQARVVVPKGGRSLALTRAEAQLHTEFGEFARHLAEQGFSTTFHINERPVRTGLDRRHSPVDLERPYERRWDKRMELRDERHTLMQLIAKPPVEGTLDVTWAKKRLADIERLLQEPPT